MATPAIVETAPLEEIDRAAVSWAAIFAGGGAAAAVSLILLAFGAGIGLSVVSPWSAGGTATAFKIVSGIYLIIMAMIASAIGGYLAGRLRARWRGASSREIFFRDTAHGLLAWAFATLLSFGLLGTAGDALVGGPSAALARTSAPTGIVLSGPVSTLLRGDVGSVGDAGSTRDAGTLETARREAAQILASGLQRGGDLTDSDRAYLAELVAARTGIGPPAAGQRVDAAVNETKAAIDKARKSAAQLALWLTASLLVGAFSASLAALEGGGLRDGTWRYRV